MKCDCSLRVLHCGHTGISLLLLSSRCTINLVPGRPHYHLVGAVIWKTDLGRSPLLGDHISNHRLDRTTWIPNRFLKFIILTGPSSFFSILSQWLCHPPSCQTAKTWETETFSFPPSLCIFSWLESAQRLRGPHGKSISPASFSSFSSLSQPTCIFTKAPR